MITGAIRACLCLLAVLPLWAADPVAGDRAELDRFAARHQAARTLRGEFAWQVRPIVGDPDPAKKPRAGSFAFAAPASYNIVVREPGGGAVDRWCSDGKARWEVSQLTPDDQADKRGPMKADEGDADYRRIIACLRLDIAALLKDHHLQYLVAGEGRVVRLMPREGGEARAPQVAAIAIHLDAQGEPRRVDIDQTDGNRWVVSVTRLERDAAVDPAQFSVP